MVVYVNRCQERRKALTEPFRPLFRRNAEAEYVCNKQYPSSKNYILKAVVDFISCVFSKSYMKMYYLSEKN